MELSEQEIIRRKKLEDLLNLGIDPYPAAEYEIRGFVESWNRSLSGSGI